MLKPKKAYDLSDDKDASFEAVFIGDIHFDKLETYFPETHLQLQDKAIRNVLDWAVSRNISTIIWGGDIAERPKLSDEAKGILLDIMFDYDDILTHHIILGNHDVKAEARHSLHLLIKMAKRKRISNLHIYESPTQCMFGDVCINFLPFPYSTPLEHPSGAGYQTLNIAHLERPGALRDNGSKVKHGVEETKHLWLIGHLHTKQKLGKNTWYPGTIYQTSFGESLPKGFAHVRLHQEGRKIRHEIVWVPVKPAFELINLIIETKADLLKVTNDVNKLYKLFVQTDILIPEDFTVKHTNIFDILGYSTEKELKTIIQMEEDSEVNFDVSTEFDAFLASKTKDKSVIKRAKALNALAQQELSSAGE